MTLSNATKLIFLCPVSLLGQPPTTSIQERASDFPVEFANEAPPRFSGGKVVARRQTPPSVRVWDSLSGSAREHLIVLPGLVVNRIVDVAASPLGSLVAAVTARSADGQSLSGLAWLRPNGELDRFVRTSPYSARTVAFAPDGSLWTGGWQYDTSRNESASYDLLRKYDPQGKLLLTAVPRSHFPADGAPPANQLRLATSEKEIYLVSTSANRIVRSSVAGQVIEATLTSFARDEIVTGAEVVDLRLLLSIQRAPDADSAKQATSRLVAFDSSTGMLRPVETSAWRGTDQTLAIFGTDQAKLLVRLRPSNRVAWVSVK